MDIKEKAPFDVFVAEFFLVAAYRTLFQSFIQTGRTNKKWPWALNCSAETLFVK